MSRAWDEYCEDRQQLFNHLKPKTNMNFRKISLSDSGFKGAELHFFQEEIKNNRPQLVLTKKYPKNPVHLGLERMFKELRIHLLQVCGLIHDSMDQAIQPMIVLETTVHTIELDGQTITLIGEKNVFEDKKIPLKTCKLEDTDGYPQFDLLNELVTNICTETEAYLGGTIVAEDTEVAIRYLEAGKAKGVDIDAIKALPPDQLKDWATRFIENTYGSVVLHNDDIVVSDEQVLAAVEELKTEFEVTTEDIEIPIAEPKTKRGKKKSEPVEAAAPVMAGASPSDNHNSEEEF